MVTSIDGVICIILQKNISRDAPQPIPLHKISYSVLARQSNGHEVECDRIRARILDNQYVITNTETPKERGDTASLGVFAMDQRELAENNMYETAKQVAEERAESYKAPIEDVTHTPVFWPKQKDKC